jgi:hypothetical protein
MPGDNFRVEVHSEGRAHFEAAVTLAFANACGGKATHFISPIPVVPCGHCAGGKSGHWKGDCKEKEYCQYDCKECGGTGQIASRPGIILLWHEDKIGGKDASVLPFPLKQQAAVDFLWHYLETGDFGEQPDHDGSNGKGFIVTTGDFWGHVCSSFYAFMAVYPDWQMYGK